MERSRRAPIVGHLAGKHHTVAYEASQLEATGGDEQVATSLGLSSPESYQTSNLSQIQVLSGDAVSNLYSPIRLVDSITGSDSTRSSLGLGHPSNHFVSNQLSPVTEAPAATSSGQQPGLSFRDHEAPLIDSGVVKRSGAESKPLPSLPNSEASVPSPGHREVPTDLHIYDSEPHQSHVRQTSNDPERLPREKTRTNERRGTRDPNSSIHKQIPSVISTKNAHRAKTRIRGRSTASPLPKVLPFIGKKRRRPSSPSPTGNINHSESTDSPAVSLIFESDSEDYDETESDDVASRARAVKLSPSRALGHGWGLRKKRQVDTEFNLQRSMPSSQTLLHQPRSSLGRFDSRTSEHSKPPARIQDFQRTTCSQRTYASQSLAAVPMSFSDSTSTVVGPAFEREMFPHMAPLEEVDTFEKLEDLRRLMEKHNLDYYIVPSEDEHGSEYVALRDKRREFISGFTGLAGEAIISKSEAYLVTDSRYRHQAKRELDPSLWTIIPLSTTYGPKDWIEWLFNPDAELTSNRPSTGGARIGIDPRMISHEKSVVINSKINLINAEIVHPRQNFVDLVWRNRPMRSEEPVFKHDIEHAGQSARLKLDNIRDWIREQPPSQPSHAKGPPSQARRQVGTLISSLPCIAWALNLRGSDIPYNLFFRAYLYVGLDKAVVFLQGSKVDDSAADYLREVGIERRDFIDIWNFLRKREWGDGKILLSPLISLAVSTILTQFRFTIAQPYVEYTMAIKNDVEVEGLRKAYLRDGAALVTFLAWLDEKLDGHYGITEWEASHRLTEFRRATRNFMGLAYQNTSATGPNAALPHYWPTKSTALMIDSETPYLIDSGGSYREGACCTARTMHYGRSTQEQREAYTRVLQGHIAVDSAVFPEGTTGQHLDALASKSLWKYGMHIMHGVGQGFGSVRTVHLRSNDIPLAPGHVVINEPGYYKHDAWGMRIGSALVVTRVRPRNTDRRGVRLCLERLTCVPIQTRIVKESMLTKEEKAWIKEHNQRCFEMLSIYLKDDKRAINWLKRETSQGLATRLVHQILPS